MKPDTLDEHLLVAQLGVGEIKLNLAIKKLQGHPEFCQPDSPLRGLVCDLDEVSGAIGHVHENLKQ